MDASNRTKGLLFLYNWRDFCKKFFVMTPVKKINLSLLIIALVIEIPIFYYFKDRLHPLKIEPVPNTYFKTGSFDYFFKDLNHDGQAEFLEIENDPTKKNHNIKIYRFVDDEPILLNQFNFRTKLCLKELTFYDLNGDGWDEIFVFSNDDDYLYLTVVDLHSSAHYFLSRQKLLAAPMPNRYTYWDLERLNPTLLDVNDDNFPELIFTVHSGLSLRPRGIYIFDIKQKKINHQFSYHAGPATLQLQDVNQNGEKEIILTTTATANWSDSVIYSDRNCWLFIFDKHLRLVMPPRSFGEPFASMTIVPFESKNKARQVIYFKSKTKGQQLLGFEHLQLKSVISLPDAVDYFITQETSVNGLLLYLFYRTLNRVEVYNINFKCVQSFSLKSTGIVTNVQLFKPSNKNTFLFFVGTLHSLQIYDKNFELLAQLPLNNQIISRISFFKTNEVSWPEFGLTTNEYFQRFKVVKNTFYGSWPALAFFSLITILGLLFIGHLGINKIRMYITYLVFSLRQSDNAIILLNGQGKIITYNKKVKEWMNLNFRSLHDYRQALGNRQQIIDVIEECMAMQKPVKRKLRFEGDNIRFYGEISVTPFFSYFKYINAFLVELRDSTEQILIERQKNWQQSVRSLVHDLKNPLAGLQLKVQTLYLKLQKRYPQAAKDLSHELETAYSEIKRIRRISQDFLKFTQLEQFHFERLDLKKFLNRVLSQFNSFRSEKLSLILNIDKNVPQEVNWDSRQIELLINIFIKNAIDALQGRGEIQITVSQIIDKNNHAFISILIQDSGPGIPSEIKDKIFDPFFTTKKEGSGMGLAFANQIVLQHRGKITIPECSDGACFLINLPVNPEKLKRGE